jgi:SAM-dependent methyltransferase
MLSSGEQRSSSGDRQQPARLPDRNGREAWRRLLRGEPKVTLDTEKRDLRTRYARRGATLSRWLRPPSVVVHNPAEKLLPACDGVKLFIGGAGGRIPPGFVNVDFVELPGVDVVADVQRLAFQAGSVAAIECDAVLEHVPDPATAVEEIYRVLRPGGHLHVLVPFCQAFHAYPSDYHRWTLTGLKQLLSMFEVVDCGVRAGPTATLLAFYLEYLKLLVGGNAGKAIAAAAGWVLWPLRYLDRRLMRRPQAHVMAHAIYVLARKPATPT